MLIANETVAEDYFWQEIPFLYRTHDKPDDEKIKALAIFINNFGYSIKVGNEDIHPKELQKLLNRIEILPRSTNQQTYTAFNEAGKVYGGKYRPFWTICKVLYILHHPYAAI